MKQNIEPKTSKQIRALWRPLQGTDIFWLLLFATTSYHYLFVYLTPMTSARLFCPPTSSIPTSIHPPSPHSHAPMQPPTHQKKKKKKKRKKKRKRKRKRKREEKKKNKKKKKKKKMKRWFSNSKAQL